jgi:CubicO group peptidase (beta-lactamase class C family)
LPEIRHYDAPVTVRMLMNHTSGIRDVWALHLLAGAGNPAAATKKGALEMLFRQKDTNFTPGSAYAYSNGGFLLLAEIVERGSGTSLAEYARRKIFAPLGMRRTMFRDGRSFVAENAAAPHVRAKEGFVVRDDYPSFSGPGGLITSINDLAKFDRDISGGNKVWTPAVHAIMDVPGALTNGEPAYTGQGGLAYGSGRMMGRRKGQYFVQHGGGGSGFQSVYARLPERQLAVAVLCNRGDVEAEDRADEIIELIEGDILIHEKQTIEQLSGSYFSEELQATYQLVVSSEQLELTVWSPSVKGSAPRLALKRSGEKSFTSPKMTLVFHEDNRGFAIAADRVRAVDFRIANRGAGR